MEKLRGVRTLIAAITKMCGVFLWKFRQQRNKVSSAVAANYQSAR
jgi:hypothetical protein